MSDVIHDTLRRPLASLRLSVTDRCNLRCRYCMPEDEYAWLPRTSILTFEEIERLTGVFSGLGVHKVRLTGGEPLLRHDLSTLVAMIARNPRIRDLAITTNGLLLLKHAAELRTAGLQRVTVSLDTLRPERMLAFAKSTRHADVLEGIAAARQAGFARLKLNAVVIRGFNDDELTDLIEFARAHDAEVRFIEYMDVGGATRWSRDQVVSQREMLDVLARRYGAIEPVRPMGDDGRATAAHRLAEKELARTVVLVDVIEGVPQGKALDQWQSAPIEGFDTRVVGANDYQPAAGSELVVVTAGIARKPGMSRDDLVRTNAEIVRHVSLQIKQHCPKAIVLVVSNPLDVMCWVAKQVTGFPRERVIGHDKRRRLPCAAWLQGEYGLSGMYCGVPCKLGRNGLEKILEVKLSPDEQAALKKSAEAVKETMAAVSLRLPSSSPDSAGR